MKKILIIALALPVLALAQTQSVSKYIANKRLTDGFVVPSGKTVTFESGSTLEVLTGTTLLGINAGDASTNTTISVDGEAAVFSSTGGKTLRRATGNGLATLTSGVLSAVTTSAGVAGQVSDETGSGSLVFASAPTLASPVFSGTLSGTYTIGGTVTFPSSVATLTDAQTLANKTLSAPSITGSVSWASGSRQTFAPDATNAGINVGAYAGDPSSLNNGDLWYDNVTNELSARINGATVALGAGGGGGMTNPMTTAEDIIVGGVSGVPARLAKGSDGQVLKVVSGVLAWDTDSTGSGSLPASPATGDMAYWNGTNWVSLAIGTAGQALLVNAGATAPEWGSGGGASLFSGRTAKTAAYTAVAGDKGYLIDCTSGTFSVSLTAAATLGDAWFVGVFNSGSGTITLDPNASETIRDQFGSATTKTLAQGEGVVLFCNGSGFYAVASSRGYGTSVAFSAAGSITSGTTLDLIAGGGNNLSLGTSGAGVVTTASIVNVTNSTASTGYNSGALVINNGGLGVRGAIYRRTPGAVNVNMSGTTLSNITAVGNVGTGEDTLISYSVPGNTLFTNGDRIRIRATFTFAANANSKTLKAKFGATTFYDSTALAINAGSAVMEAVITRTGASTQNISATIVSSNATLPHTASVTTSAESLGSAVTLSFTGEATSNDDIIQRELMIEYMPTP